MMITTKQTVEQYIDSFPPATQHELKQIRKFIKALVVGEKSEVISYGIPTVKINGKNVLHYGGFHDHISLYPASDQMIKQIPALASHRTGKGTIQFSLSKPLDYELITQAIKFLLAKV